MAITPSTIGTQNFRSGDRVRNGMLLAGLSLTSISILLDPYITWWMGHQTTAYGVQFTDPEAWKDAAVQFAVVAMTGLWGVVHMRMIRTADNDTGAVADEQKFADAEIGRLTAELETLRRNHASTLGLSSIVTHADIAPKT